MPSTDPQPSSKPRQRTLRFQLACLVLACIIPVCIIAGFVVDYAYQQQRRLTEQHVLEVTRALSMVVDGELATIQASATALATSPFLVSGSLLAFRGQAQAVLPDYPAAAAITLTDATGQQIVNTFVPLGTALPKRVVWDRMQRVFETGKPVIINLYRGAISGRPVVGVAVPVIRDGRVVYVLTVTVPTSHFDAVVSQRGIPAEWIAAVNDASGVMVARNPPSESYVGLPATPLGQKLTSADGEGVLDTVSRAGIPLVTMFSRSPKSGWTVLIAIPKAVMLADIRQWLWWTIGGSLLLLAIGIGFALLMARRISGAIHALIAPAFALGAGEPVEIGPLDLAETDKVRQSLEEASQLLQQRTAERERAEKRIAHLASFPELNASPILEIDLQGAITYSNPEAKTRFPDITELGASHPVLKDWSAVTAALGAGAQRRIVTREVEFDGAVFHQTINYLPDVSVVRVYFADITQRKQAEDSLRQSEERWSTTLHSIGDAVISTDAKGRVMFMNDVAEKLTGWPLSEARGHDLEEVFHIVNELTRYRPESPVAKVIRMGQVVGLANHTALLSRGGTELPIEDSGAPIRDKEGRITGVVLVFHDISEKRRAEKAVRDSERLAMTGRMASTLAHEIHNPLDTVGGLLYLIERDPDAPAEVRQHAALASEEVARVTQMTRHMLSFQRESKKPVPIKIGEILDNVIAMYQKKIESAAIKIEKQVEFEGEFIGLPGEMRQVIANLVGNAIEAIGKNGRIRLHAYSGTDWRQGRRGLRVTIADNGPGIPADVRDKIFDPFFTTKGEAGTGLGLWIISGIIENSDGTLRLRSVTGDGRSGTCFSVFFPFPA